MISEGNGKKQMRYFEAVDENLILFMQRVNKKAEELTKKNDELTGK